MRTMRIEEYKNKISTLTQKQKQIYDRLKEDYIDNNKGIIPEGLPEFYSSRISARNALQRLQGLGLIFLDQESKRFKFKPLELKS